MFPPVVSRSLQGWDSNGDVTDVLPSNGDVGCLNKHMEYDKPDKPDKPWDSNPSMGGSGKPEVERGTTILSNIIRASGDEKN